MLIIPTKDDQMKELQYKTEKQDHENILKSLKIDKDFYRKKYESLNKKKVLLTSASPEYSGFSNYMDSNQKQADCLGGRNKSNSYNIIK